MLNLPFYVYAVFGITTLLAVFLFYKAAGNSKKVLFILLGWMVVQTPLSATGFFTDTHSMPPRFAILTLPPLLGIAALFILPAGRRFIDNLSNRWLTILHIVRMPVEMVLFWLFINRAVPELMTFEGRNFDILSGVTAPVVYYFAFVKHQLSRRLLLVWNMICLGLLFNILAHAVLSLPYPFQQMAFEQPNIGVLHFPFVWLPSLIVPLVLLAHLSSTRKLWKEIKQNQVIALQ